jgi:hypothetical protein
MVGGGCAMADAVAKYATAQINFLIFDPWVD